MGEHRAAFKKSLFASESIDICLPLQPKPGNDDALRHRGLSIAGATIFESDFEF
jgi:hypothetical protein